MGGTMATLFEYGTFISHSGRPLKFKIKCEALDDVSIETCATIIAGAFTFKRVHGIPTGGLRLAKALEEYCSPQGDADVLIVDDVLTTSRSMVQARNAFK